MTDVIEVEKWVITDKVAGTKERRKVSKQVKPWWFVGANDKVMLELRFSNRRIDIAGKASIVVGTPDKLVATLSTVKKAVMAGELDLVMKGATDGRKKGRKEDWKMSMKPAGLLSETGHRAYDEWTDYGGGLR